MGANLIGYVLIGPSCLNNPEAVRMFAENRHAALRKMLTTPAEEWTLEHDERMRAIGFADLEQEDQEALAELDPGKITDAFVRLWEGEDRPWDSTIKELDFLGLQILVCGNTSWGDEPDGDGYQTCKWAEALGLFDEFDIK